MGNNFSHLTLEFKGFVIYIKHKHYANGNKCVIAYSKQYAHAVGLVLSTLHMKPAETPHGSLPDSLCDEQAERRATPDINMSSLKIYNWQFHLQSKSHQLLFAPSLQLMQAYNPQDKNTALPTCRCSTGS